MERFSAQDCEHNDDHVGQSKVPGLARVSDDGHWLHSSVNETASQCSSTPIAAVLHHMCYVPEEGAGSIVACEALCLLSCQPLII